MTLQSEGVYARPCFICQKSGLCRHREALVEMAILRALREEENHFMPIAVANPEIGVAHPAIVAMPPVEAETTETARMPWPRSGVTVNDVYRRKRA